MRIFTGIASCPACGTSVSNQAPRRSRHKGSRPLTDPRRDGLSRWESSPLRRDARRARPDSLPTGRWLDYGLQEGFEHAVGPPGPVPRELRQRLVRRPRGLIRPGAHERVVDVEHADDLRGEWDFIALEAVGVTGPVVPLVVPADDGFEVPGELDARQQLDPPDRVHLHQLALLARERTRLAKQLVRDAQLAYVVHIGTQEDRCLIVVVELQHPGHRDGVSRHALAVAKRVAVARFDGLTPGAYHRQVR